MLEILTGAVLIATLLATLPKAARSFAWLSALLKNRECQPFVDSGYFGAALIKKTRSESLNLRSQEETPQAYLGSRWHTYGARMR